MLRNALRLLIALFWLSIAPTFADAQQVYAGTFFGNQLLEYPGAFPSTGTVVASPAQGALGVAGIAQRSGDNSIYFSSQLFNPGFQLGDSIMKYTPGVGVTPVVTHATLNEIVNPGNPSGTNSYAPGGITFGSDGLLYVARTTGLFPTPGASAIDRFNPNTGAFVDTFVPNLTGTVGVTASGSNLFISNRLLSYDFSSDPVPGNVIRVSNYTTAPSSLVLISGGAGTARFPVNSAMGPDGKLYVADVGDEIGTYSGQNFFYSGAIHRYDPATGAEDPFFSMPMPGKSPSGLAFTADGNLIVANLGTTYGPDIPPGLPFNGTLEIWDVSGTSPSFVDRIESGLMASSVLVTPIPEPALLMAVGIGAVLVARRRLR